MSKQDEQPDPPPPPRTIRTAVGVWLAVAVFLLATIALSWAAKDSIRQQALTNGSVAPDQVDDLVRNWLLRGTLFAAAFGGAYIGLALALKSGRPWARTAITIVAVVNFLLFVLSGGLSPVNLVVLLMLAGALVLSWLRTSSEWLAEMRSLTG